MLQQSGAHSAHISEITYVKSSSIYLNKKGSQKQSLIHDDGLAFILGI